MPLRNENKLKEGLSNAVLFFIYFFFFIFNLIRFGLGGRTDNENILNTVNSFKNLDFTVIIIILIII